VLVDGRNIYASSFQHRLFASRDGGATWSIVQAPVAPSVTAIARLPNGDFLAATELPPRAKTVLVLRGADFLALPAQPWKELKADRGYSQSPLIALSTAMANPIQDQHVVWTGGRQVHRYDAAQDRWTSATAPSVVEKLYGSRTAGLVYFSGPVVSGAMTATGLRLNDGALSADGGTTWQELALGRHVAFGFRDRMNGIALVADLRGFKPELFTDVTTDGGKTWTRVGSQVPGFCVAAAYVPSTAELICMRNDGNIQSTRTGEQWTLERAVF
jgi:hypothetical protein